MHVDFKGKLNDCSFGVTGTCTMCVCVHGCGFVCVYECVCVCVYMFGVCVCVRTGIHSLVSLHRSEAPGCQVL